jgi:hypothetical protein
MRDRLVELIKQEIDCNKAGIIPEWLANYLIENGVIVLPCPIGTKIYHLDLEIPDNEPQCSECKNNYSGFGEFFCDEDYIGWPSMEDKLCNPKDVCPKFKPYIVEGIFTLSFWVSHEKWLNKTWFLTEDEAEKALEDIKQMN